MKKIPDEVWLKIFGYLSNGTILRTISGVCKHFWQLSQDSSLISKLHLSVHGTSALKTKRGKELACNMICNLKFLKSLTIDDRNSAGFHTSNPEAEKNDIIMAGAFLCATLKSCPHLKYIKLQNVNFLDSLSLDILASENDIFEGVDVSLMNINSKYLVAIANKFQVLEYLSIKDQLHDLSPDAIDYLITKRKNSLKQLYFFGGFNINGNHLRNLHLLCDTLEEFAINCAYQLGKNLNS